MCSHSTCVAKSRTIFCVALTDRFWQICAESGSVHSMSPYLTLYCKCVPNLGPYILSPYLTSYDKCVPNLGQYILCHPGRRRVTNLCQIRARKFYVALVRILTNVCRILFNTFYVALVDVFWQMCVESWPVHSMSPWLTSNDKCFPNLSPYILCPPGWRILIYVCRIWPVHSMSPWLMNSDKCVPNLGRTFYVALVDGFWQIVPNMATYILCRPGWLILINVCRIWAHKFYVTLVDEFWQMCAEFGTIHSMSPWLTDSDKCVPIMGPYILCWPGWRILTNVCRI